MQNRNREITSSNRNKVKNNFFLFLSAIVSFSASPAIASSPFIGGHLGLGFPNNNLGTSLTFGANAGYPFLPPLSIGVFLDYLTLGNISSSAVTLNGSTQTMLYFGAEGNYDLGLFLEGLSAGVKLGLASTSISATVPAGFSGSVSNTHLLIGPKLAYDYFVVDSRVSLGGELSLLFKTTSAEPIAGFTTANSVTMWLNTLGTVKLWF